jgi:hypothetical protein
MVRRTEACSPEGFDPEGACRPVGSGACREAGKAELDERSCGCFSIETLCQNSVEALAGFAMRPWTLL